MLLLSLEPSSKTCLFCDLVITSKEARNNISVSVIATLKKPGGIAVKWLKVKPVSSYAKNYELLWDKIKDLYTQSEDYQGVRWPAHATCHCNFHNTKKLKTNSKRKINEIDEQNIAYSAYFVCEKDELHFCKYSSTKHEDLIRCELSRDEGDDGQSGVR